MRVEKKEQEIGYKTESRTHAAGREAGSMTLETAIVLPIFMFLFLFIFSLFWVVSAQNQITHAFVQSAKSLSQDSYLTENSEGISESSFWTGLDDMFYEVIRIGLKDDYYSSNTTWYESNAGSAGIAKKRFVGYLTGGDEDEANEKLENLGVDGGLDGITFRVQVSGEETTITISYELEYLFDFFGAGTVPMEQTVTVRMWM